MQKYLSLTGHVYTPAYLDGRREEVGDAAGRRAQGARGHGEGDAGVRLREGARKDDDELLGKLKQAGMQVNEADKDAFIAARKPVYEEFAQGSRRAPRR